MIATLNLPLAVVQSPTPATTTCIAFVKPFELKLSELQFIQLENGNNTLYCFVIRDNIMKVDR